MFCNIFFYLQWRRGKKTLQTFPDKVARRRKWVSILQDIINIIVLVIILDVDQYYIL